MILAALTVALFLALQNTHAQLKCGLQADAYPPNYKSKTRIIGGTEATPHSWPWLIFLTYKGDIECGASLIQVEGNTEASDMLLTSAQCVACDKTRRTAQPMVLTPISSIQVLAGIHRSWTKTNGTVIRKAAAVEFSPGLRGLNNDLAIIKLETPIPFSDTIRPVCLPTQGEKIPVGGLCVAAGWGRNQTNNSETPEALQQLILTANPASICKSSWGSTYVEDQMICAGTLTGKSATCEGDTGGPLVCRKSGLSGFSWVLYGAASFQADDKCAVQGKPPVFTRVSNYVDWINERTHALSDLAIPSK